MTSEPPAAAPPGHAAILAGIREVAHEHLDWQRELPLEARLIEDLELDSIRLLTLAVEVENRFRIALDPEDEAGIVTVADLVETVARRLAKNHDDDDDAEDEDGDEGEASAESSAGERGGGEP